MNHYSVRYFNNKIQKNKLVAFVAEDEIQIKEYLDELGITKEKRLLDGEDSLRIEVVVENIKLPIPLHHSYRMDGYWGDES